LSTELLAIDVSGTKWPKGCPQSREYLKNQLPVVCQPEICIHSQDGFDLAAGHAIT